MLTKYKIFSITEPGDDTSTVRNYVMPWMDLARIQVRLTSSQ